MFWVPLLITLFYFYFMSRLTIISHGYHSFKSILVFKIYFNETPFTFFLHFKLYSVICSRAHFYFKCKISEGY